MLGNCKIKRNKEQKIQTVLNPQGVESQAFKSLAQIPFNTMERALEDFKQVLNFTESDNPVLFRVGDSVYSTYKQALNNSQNRDIEVIADGNTVKTISSNTNPNNRVGFINNAIKNNLIEDTNIIEDGVTYLQGYGYSDFRTLAGETVLKEFGLENSEYFEFHPDGRISFAQEERLERDTFPNLKDQVGESRAFFETVFKGIGENLFGNQKQKKSFLTSEDNLKNQILDLFNKLGFSITTIDNYEAQYNLKNGELPNAEALIDLANQVVAFKNGEITIEALSEEFVHFATGSLNLSDVLPQVVNTVEYQRQSEHYREIYSQIEGLSAEEVENLVRKEILDKIIAQELVRRTQENQNLFQTVWQRIVEFFQSLSQSDFKSEVQDLTNKVSDLLLSQDITSLQDLQPRRFRMYRTAQSATPALTKDRQDLLNLLEGLRQQELTLSNRGANVNALKALIKKTEDASVDLDMNSAIDLALRQVEYVEQAINQSQATQEPLSAEERLVGSNLVSSILPLLNKISPYVKNKGVKDSLDNATLRIAKLDLSTSSEVLDKLVDRIMMNSNLPKKVQLNVSEPEHVAQAHRASGHKGTIEEWLNSLGNPSYVEIDTRQFILNALEQADKDTNVFFSFLGQATHAKDPALNLLGKVLSDMHNSTHQRFYDGAKPFVNDLEKLGMRPGDLSKFFDKDGWITSFFDWQKFQDAQIEVETELYSQFFEVDIAEATKAVEQGLNRDNLDYQRELSRVKRQLEETFFTEEFYTQRDARLEGIPEAVQNKLRQIDLDRSQLMRNVEFEDGIPMFTNQDRLNLDAINLDRKKATNPYSIDTGELKDGLEFAEEGEDGAVPAGGVFIKLKDKPSEDAQIAYHLNRMNNEFLNNLPVKPDSKSAFKRFKEIVSRIESEKGREAAINFIKANVNFGFDDSLFNEPFTDRLDEAVRTTSDLDIRKEYREYKKLVSKRKNILKQFQDPKNATNILGERMSPETMEYVRELTRDISTKRNSLMKAFDLKYEASEDGKTVASPNTSFLGMLKDNDAETDLDKRLSLTMKHVNLQSLNTLYSIYQALDMASIGSKLPSFTVKMIARNLGDPNMTLEQIKERVKSREGLLNLKIQLAEDRLAPYYKTFRPVGLTNMEQDMNDPNISATQFIESIMNSGDVKVTLHQSYYEMTNDKFKNENHKTNFKAFRKQPKQGDITVNVGAKQFKYNFKNERFLWKTQGIQKLDEYGLPESIDPNDKQYQAYRSMLDMRMKSLEIMNEDKKTNLFRAPQVSMSLTERINALISRNKGNKKAILKESFRELINFRADEQVQGEEDSKGNSILKSTGVRVIPKRYVRDLETQADVTRDLFSSTMLFYKEAILYSERQKALGSVMALEEAMLTRKRKDSKAFEATNTGRMFKHYIDSNIFGNTEQVNFRVDLPIVGAVDVAKILKSLHKFLRFKNLAFKIAIPMTSWITAEVNLMLEKHIGQYLDKGSVRSARKVLMKHSNAALNESMKINKTSHISLIGEYMDSFDLERSYENSQFNVFGRFLGKFSMGLHTAGNYTPVTTSFLSYIIGRRVYGGNFLTFNNFKEQYRMDQEAQGNKVSDKQIQAEWNALESKSFYSYLSTANKTVDVDLDRMRVDLGFQGTQEEFEKSYRQIHRDIMGETKKFVERIDGNISQEERTWLQNHFMGQYTMTHKAWLSIGIANRFKSNHLNFNSGIQEEGSYVTMARKMKEFMNETFGAVKRKDFKSIKNTFTDLYLKANATEKANMRRVAKDFGVVSALYLLVLGLRGFADDEENQDLWAVQFTTYLSERTLNETTSTSLGIFEEMANSIKEPVVGFSNILKTLNVFTLFDTDEYKSGKYQGLSKGTGYLIDNFPGLKETYILRSGSSVEQTRRGYEYYNDPHDWNLLALFLEIEDK